MVCCGTGTDWGTANCEDSFRIFIGIAAAAVFGCLSRVALVISGEGVAPIPVGVEIFSEKINSSRFMTSAFSAAVWSELSRSCAMPLGADEVADFANLL